MLDTFEILTTSGVVLWSRTYAAVSPAVVNNFISDVFIEEKSAVAGTKDGASASANPPYKHDQHTLRWSFEKELGIIFVVCASPLPCALLHPSRPLADIMTRRRFTDHSYISHGSTSSLTTSGLSL